MIDRFPKSEFSKYLNKNPESLVMKVRVKIPPHVKAMANAVFGKLSFQMQKQVNEHGRKGSKAYPCPALVSWREMDHENPSGWYLVAVTFNLRAFGLCSPETIKKLTRTWITKAWGISINVWGDTVHALLRFPHQGEVYTPLIPGSSHYRFRIENLEQIFSGEGTQGQLPGYPFKHKLGFYPCKSRAN